MVTITSKKKKFQGPVRKGRDVQTFRTTGKSGRASVPSPTTATPQKVVSKGRGSVTPPKKHKLGKITPQPIKRIVRGSVTPPIISRIRAIQQARERRVSVAERPPLVVDVAPKPSVLQRIERERVRGFEDTKEFFKRGFKKFKQSKPFTDTVKAFDFVSGGVVTESRINKKEDKINQDIENFNNKFVGNQTEIRLSEKLNQDIENFNKRFGGKELNETQFNQANKISIELDKRFQTRENKIARAETQVKNLDKRIKDIEQEKKEFVESPKGKVVKFTGIRRSQIIKEFEGKQRIKSVPKLEKQLEKLKKDLKKSEGKSGRLAELNKNRIKLLITSKNKEIKNAKAGRPRDIRGGTVQIIPASAIPTGVSLIKFTGSQRTTKGGKIITDILFETSRGRVGIAKGVSVEASKDSATIVLGRSGKVNIKLPSGKNKITRLRSFISGDKAISIPKTITLKKTVELGKVSKALSKKELAKLSKALRISKKKELAKLKRIAKELGLPFKRFKDPKILLARLKKIKLKKLSKGKVISKARRSEELRIRNIARELGLKPKTFKSTQKLLDKLKNIESKKIAKELGLPFKKAKVKKFKKLKPITSKRVLSRVRQQEVKKIKSIRKQLGFKKGLTNKRRELLQKRLSRITGRKEFKVAIKKSKLEGRPIKIKRVRTKVKKAKVKKFKKLKPITTKRVISRVRKQEVVSRVRQQQLVAPRRVLSRVRQREIVRKSLRSGRVKRLETLDLKSNLNRLIKKGIVKRTRGTTQKAFIQSPIKTRVVSQTSKGVVRSVKGKKFRVEVGQALGKPKTISKKALQSDFSSASAIFNKEELSLIIGKTIQDKIAKAKFIGIIKRAGSPRTTSTGKTIGQTLIKKTELDNALKKVVEATVKSIDNINKAKGGTKATLLSTSVATVLSQKIASGKGIVTKQKITPKTKTIRKGVTQRVKQKPKTITRQASKQTQAVAQKLKVAQKTQVAQRTAIKSAVAQRTALRTKQAQKTILRTKQALRTARSPIIIPRLAVPRAVLFGLPKLKPKRRKAVTTKKVKGGFNVFAKPVKGKKLVKVNKVPLRKSDALDLRNFIIDTSLSRTGKIKSTKRKTKRRSIKVPRGFAPKTQKKFRTFRIVKGKRFPLNKGKVIERKNRLLDTRQEVRGITLRRRIKQLSRPKTKRKVKKRKGRNKK